MGHKSKGLEQLENAYALNTPQDNIAYYRDFAKTYDSDFATDLGYCYPATVARIFQQNSNDQDVPIADIGCGTGLLGAALDHGPIDGMDISPDMLAVAKRRQTYRDLIAIDLADDLGNLRCNYGAVISSGTFTHGHLGPEVLISLLDIARSEAVFVIGVNKEHYHARGFDAALRAVRAAGRIGDIDQCEVPIYSRQDHDHAKETALVLTWRLV